MLLVSRVQRAAGAISRPHVPGDDVEVCESFGNRTDFEFQIRDSAGDVIANLCIDDPDDYHAGWESESFPRGQRAMIVVEEFARNPGHWRRDGSAEKM